MIRAYDDCWSRKTQTAKYESPIASCLNNYSLHLFNGTPSLYQQPIPEIQSRNLHELVVDNRQTIRKLLKEIAEHKNDESVSLTELASNENVSRILLNSDFPECAVNLLINESDKSSQAISFRELFRLIVFSRYLLERVTITEVTAKNEDYAFDMFESLNTTGEPLTAYETFKPRVIHAEGLGDYETSECRKYLSHVETYLDKHKKAQDRQQATNALLSPFALAESGEKLGRRLSDQRRYLKEQFDLYNELSEKREFIRHLSHCSILLSEGWLPAAKKRSEIIAIDADEFDRTALCLSVLQQAGHDIVLAPLTRFYSRFRSADAADRELAQGEFAAAIRAVTAFFVFWRGSRIGTAGIDGHYRTIMRDGCSEAGVPPLARTKMDESETLSADGLCKAFRHILKGGDVKCKADWIKLAATTPLYKQSKPLTRFMLLAAAHDTTPDSEKPGLIKLGRPDISPMLNWKRWQDDSVVSVEHIAPQTPKEGWDSSLYEDEHLINQLGNLALLPVVENASAGNRPWTEKRLIYRLLASSSEDELDSRLGDANEAGIDISPSTEAILKRSKYTPHVSSVSQVTEDWSREIINTRGANLAGVIWDRIAPWLGFESKQ